MIIYTRRSRRSGIITQTRKGQFGQMRFPEADQPQLRRAAQHLAIFGRHTIFEQNTASFSRHMRAVKQIFPRDRNPIERRLLLTQSRPFRRRPRLCQSSVMRHNGVNARCEGMGIDRIKKGLR